MWGQYTVSSGAFLLGYSYLDSPGPNSLALNRETGFRIRGFQWDVATMLFGRPSSYKIDLRSTVKTNPSASHRWFWRVFCASHVIIKYNFSLVRVLGRVVSVGTRIIYKSMSKSNLVGLLFRHHKRFLFSTMAVVSCVPQVWAAPSSLLLIDLIICCSQLEALKPASMSAHGFKC